MAQSDADSKNAPGYSPRFCAGSSSEGTVDSSPDESIGLPGIAEEVPEEAEEETAVEFSPEETAEEEEESVEAVSDEEDEVSSVVGVFSIGLE